MPINFDVKLGTQYAKKSGSKVRRATSTWPAVRAVHGEMARRWLEKNREINSGLKV